MDENNIIKKIKTLLIGFEDLSETEYKKTTSKIAELQNQLNEDKTKPEAIICTNCGLITRSIFEFTEHYDCDTTGLCSDVHY